MRSVHREFCKHVLLQFFAPDGAVSGGGATSGAAATLPGATPVDTSLLDELPGGEMLIGAMEVKPVEAEAAEWSQEDDEEAGDSRKEGEPSAEQNGDDDEDEENEEGQQQPAAEKEGELAATDVPADWPEDAKTRVAALAAERETLSKEKTDLTTKVADLEGRVAAGSAPNLAPTRSNPLSHIRDTKGLQANEQFAETLKSFAFRASKDGAEMPKDLQAALEGVPADKITEARTVTADEAMDLYEQAEAMLKKYIPARQQYLSEESAAQAALQELAPEMLKTDSEEGKVYASFLQQFPEAKLLSRWPTMLAATVIGHRVLEERAKLKGKATENTEGSERGRKEAQKTQKGAVAPGSPAPPRGGGASNRILKPKPQVLLSASMDAEELAALM